MRTQRTGRGLPEVSTPSPSDQVLAWRREQLLAAGFDEATALHLARQRGVDLHAVLNLVARGCPPALAARIMDTDAGPGAGPDG